MPAAMTRRSALRRWSRRAELTAAGIGATLMLAGFLAEPLWGDVHARHPPLSAVFGPAFGPSLLLAVALAWLAIRHGRRLALTLPWRPLLALTWATGLLWGLSLALARGWQGGIAEPLSNPAEYLADIDRAGNMGPLLSGFADHIVYTDPEHWTTQVAGHPPLPFLFYVGLDKVGLGGPAWGGMITALIGSTGIVAVMVTLRAVGETGTARRAAPFLALTPAVIWLVVAADGIFMATAAWSIALVALALTHRRTVRGFGLALGAGVGLGMTLFMSYGLVLLLPVAAAVLAVRRSVWPVLPTAVGAAAVTLLFATLGFWWFDGQSAVLVRYYEGIGALRPYSFWVWANFAALSVAVGPAVLAGVGAAIHRVRSIGARVPPSYWFAAAAGLGLLAATLSGLSKSEVERIWLPFMVWLIPLTAALSPARTRWWLAAQTVSAGLVAVLMDTTW